MASLGARAISETNGLTFAAGVGAGFLGMGLTFAAGMIDRAAAGRIAGRGKRAFEPVRIFEGGPSGVTSSPGAPRVFAFGRRVRVPMHVMFYAQREITGGGSSKGSTGTVQATRCDIALGLNSRPINRLTQIVGRGALIYWTDRNLTGVTTDGMTATRTAGVEHDFLTVAMSSVDEVDLSTRFTVARQESGTATSGTGTTLVDSSKSWTTSQWVGYWLRIMSGTGAGQVRRIDLNSANTLVIAGAAWTTNPDATSQYQIEGACEVAHLSGWIGTPSISGYWRVVDVTPHGATPSTLKLVTLQGHVISGLSVTAGSPNTPAKIVRVDDAAVESGYEVTEIITSGGNRVGIELDRMSADFDISRVFSVGDLVRTVGYTGGVDGLQFRVDALESDRAVLSLVSGSTSPATVTAGTVSNAGRIEYWTPQTAPPNLFGDINIYRGDEAQTADDIITQTKPIAQTPGYRGQAYVAFDEFNETGFGGSFPPDAEAIIEPDLDFSWRDAIRLICSRSGIEASELDLAGLPEWQFDGGYLQGEQPGVTALQPIMVAGQIVPQERSGQLAFFRISDAEVVQIENGAAYSDMGASVGGASVAKSADGTIDDSQLPVQVRIVFQDPDRNYGVGSETWALRHASAPRDGLRSEIDLSNMVVSKREARDLAATIVRRAWTNGATRELTLPIAYADLLENDCATWTDDDGEDHLVRIIRREMGTDFTVHLTGVVEDVDAEVTGSPAQNGAGIYGNPLTNVASLRVEILDIPPVTDQLANSPGVLICSSARRGSRFAGARVYESIDGGSNYTSIGTVGNSVVMGETTTTLAASGTLGWPPGTGTIEWDTVSTVTVRIDSGDLFTFPDAAVISGVNWCVVGDEIMAFATVTQVSTGVYTLSRLLRGLRGTHDAAGAAKTAGARFVLLAGALDLGAMFRDLRGVVSIGATINYKVVPTGARFGDIAAIPVVFSGWNARPLPVLTISKAIPVVAPFDAQFSFQNWTRRNLPLGTATPYALDEPFEEYELTVYDPTGATVVRTVTLTSVGTGTNTLRDPWLYYTTAQQIADGYTPSGSTTFAIGVRQRGAYGYSKARRATV